ncbi:hypothetical protein ABZW32_13825 [Streptomyces sp. NPDC004667]|uniref:DUF7848 domain-containing protein n=1 Tax=Streptomyces sp. NPDC004667 TaxID=3154285 RepID=UPI0033B985E5
MLRHVPEDGVTHEAFCRAYCCPAGSGPRDEEGDAEDWALGHARRTGHELFRRVRTDHARVVSRCGPG